MFKQSIILSAATIIFSSVIGNAVPGGNDDLLGGMENGDSSGNHFSYPRFNQEIIIYSPPSRDEQPKISIPVMGYDADPEALPVWNLLPLDMKVIIASRVCSSYELYKLRFAQISKECMIFAGFETVTELASAIKEYGVVQEREKYKLKYFSEEYQRKQIEKMDCNLIAEYAPWETKLDMLNKLSIEKLCMPPVNFNDFLGESTNFENMETKFQQELLRSCIINFTPPKLNVSPLDATIAQIFQPTTPVFVPLAALLQPQQNQSQDTDSEDEE